MSASKRMCQYASTHWKSSFARCICRNLCASAGKTYHLGYEYWSEATLNVTSWRSRYVTKYIQYIWTNTLNGNNNPGKLSQTPSYNSGIISIDCLGLNLKFFIRTKPVISPWISGKWLELLVSPAVNGRVPQGMTQTGMKQVNCLTQGKKTFGVRRGPHSMLYPSKSILIFLTKLHVIKCLHGRWVLLASLFSLKRKFLQNWTLYVGSDSKYGRTVCSDLDRIGSCNYGWKNQSQRINKCRWKAKQLHILDEHLSVEKTIAFSIRRIDILSTIFSL